MFEKTYLNEIAEIIEKTQCWSIIGLTAKAVRENCHQGADDGYNQEVNIDEGMRTSIGYKGGFKCHDSIWYNGSDDVSFYTKKEGLYTVPGLLIQGGCGYGSKVQGFIQASQAEFHIQSCGGHYVKLKIYKQDGGRWKYNVEVETDDHYSEQSWGDQLDGYKAQESRRNNIMDRIEESCRWK